MKSKIDKLSQIKGYIANNLEWPDDIAKKKQIEGDIAFTVADSESIYDAPAFFNPVMVRNRDLAILFACLYADEYDLQLRVFEPLAGIGVRAFRMAKEIPDRIGEIIISDYNLVTTAIANYNKQKLGLENTVFQFKREARSLAFDLAENRMKYHFVDLDPFGSPSPFIDSIWSLMALNGLVAVTATDMTSLCGVYPDACLRKYGGKPLNNHHTHETAARILIAMIARSAGRFERDVVPIFTSSIHHYTKIFFTSRKSRGAANKSVSNIGYSYTCNSCHQIYYRDIEALEPSCCGTLARAGPLWIGDIFDETWCKKGIELLDKLDLPSEKTLRRFLEEGQSSSGLPGYYQMGSFCKNLGTSQPSFDEIFNEIEERGYRVVRSWFTDQAFRSNISGNELKKVVNKLIDNKDKV